MARAQVDAETLERLMQLLGYEEQLLEALTADLYREYDAAGNSWNDQAYWHLGEVIRDCVEQCKHTSVDLTQVRERLGRLLVAVRRYEETSVDGGGGSVPASGAPGAAGIAAAAVGGAAGAAVGGAGAVPRNTVESIAGWIGSINPNYNNNFFPEARVNCGSCAFAVEARLNGDSSAIASLTNIGTDEEMEAATGKRCRYMEPGEIASRLIQQGPGSHLIVGINRVNFLGMPTPGHWFNVFYDGSAIYTIDGQSGEIHGFPYDYGEISEWCALVDDEVKYKAKRLHL